MPRVLIVDDHAVIRRGVEGILSGFPEWQICGQADNGQDGLKLAAQLQPELVIMDVSMPGLNGLEATRIMRDVVPETKVLLLTLHCSPEFVRSAFKAGARGYVLKSDAEIELVRAMNIVVAEGTYVSPSIDSRAAQEAVTAS